MWRSSRWIWFLIIALAIPLRLQGQGIAPLLVVLASESEQQMLETDIAEIENQNWNLEQLERRLNQWASQRKLIMQKENVAFYIGISQKLVEHSFYGKQLTLLRLLCSAMEQSQAIALHRLPDDLREMLSKLLATWQPYPNVFVTKKEKHLNQNRYLMLGALLCAEVPVENGEKVRVVVRNLFPFPDKWGPIESSFLDNRLPQRETSHKTSVSTEAIVILRTKFVDIKQDSFHLSFKKLIELWKNHLEQQRQQYEKELSGLRQKLAELASEHSSLPLDEEVSFSNIPNDIAQEILRKLNDNGYNISLKDLNKMKIKFNITIQLQVAYLSLDRAIIQWLPFGGDYGPIHSYEIPFNQP